ncbi:MAG: GHMP kinase, partial [Butyrivibrio sp.]|nr:GHMP kinase [Butyrivibrio sp.]
ENGVIELQSLNFPKRAQFHVNSIPYIKVGDWADYCRGAAKVLAEKWQLRYGLSAVIEGELPIGGLSSSASVIIAFMSALATVNEIKLDEWNLIMMAKKAENEYVGVNCGKLDQSCEVLGRAGSWLYLDCANDSYSLISMPDTMPSYKIVIFFSGLERSLADSAYNLRLDECRAAAYDLLAFAGVKYGKFNDTVLRDVPTPIFEEYKEKLPINFRKRAEHFFSENARVKAGIKAWMAGDIVEFGRLVFESGKSSIQNYECGCPELITLYEIMTRTDGIYGGRFSGAGFKGCCIAIVDSKKVEDVLRNVEDEYLRIYPNMAGKYLSTVCSLADGVGVQL